MIKIREAREEDVGQIREIFLAVYGDDYPHRELYDELWLKRSVFTDDALILVAEDTATGRVVGTASVLFDFGAHSDLVGEFGRLAVHPDYRRMQVGKLLMDRRIEAIKNRLHVGLVVARTIHPYAQRISLAQGFIATGFLPLKHFFCHRESFALLARYFGDALALRRNNPRIIPEVHALANLVMSRPPLAPDFIVDEDSASYPIGGDYHLEQMEAEGYPAVLRIERGRVRNREIFGPMRLDYGFFKLQARHTSYFIARSMGQIVGAIGFTMDPVEHTVRVFELISLADDVVRFLLAELERKCREEMGIEYIEIDVSAYAPRMQRTLLELNFLPVAYVPAMVFYQVERLDIVKMVRLNRLQDLGPLDLAVPVQAVADVVMRGFSTCVIAPRMARAIKEVPLFHGMNMEQATRLAGICGVRNISAGELLFTEREPADRLHLVLQGEVTISSGTTSKVIGTVRTGEICGEVSLLSVRPHSATANAVNDIETAELLRRDLEDLIRRRPDIGVIIYRNLAVGLADKLLRSGDLKPDQERNEADSLPLA
jgi:predicted N-acetyltransferase YhbS